MDITSYFLSQHTYFCDCGEGIVFLNAKRNRYFAYPRDALMTLRRLVPEWPAAGAAEEPNLGTAGRAQDILPALLQRGILTQDRARSRVPTPTKSDVRGSLEASDRLHRRPNVGVRHVVRFVVSVALSALRLRLLSLATILKILERQKRILRARSASPVDMDRISALLSAYFLLRSWTYTARDHCLFDSLSLVEFFYRHGLAATWVIGVDPKPFAAHCWASCDGLVLNDTADHVNEFLPIASG